MQCFLIFCNFPSFSTAAAPAAGGVGTQTAGTNLTTTSGAAAGQPHPADPAYANS